MRPIGRAFAVFALIICLQGMTWACSARPASVVPPPAPPDQPPDVPRTTQVAPASEPAPGNNPLPRATVDECALIPFPGEPIATVGLADPIDPSNAPHPSNTSERLLFAQLYETLVQVDCMGRVRPGLASSWRLDETTGRLWIVTLRDNARFSDGAPVSAADVRASWTRDGAGGGLATSVSRLVASVDVVDDRTLAIRLSGERIDAPVALAHPDLLVARRVADRSWPLGTRASRLAANVDTARAITRSELTVSRDHLPPLRFLVASGDPRDLLDAGVDLLLTRDPATLDYAATLPHFQRVPLAWHRTHVLLTPRQAPPPPSLSDDARQALAADAVRGEARGAQGSFWWESPPACDLIVSDRVAPQASPRVVYDATDGAARDLAERFVGLAGGPAAAPFLDALFADRLRRTFQRATGLRGDDLARALRSGTDAGYVISVQSRPLDPCAELGALIERIPWIKPWTIVPLVDTRLQALVRQGRSGITADVDGGVVLDSVNPSESR